MIYLAKLARWYIFWCEEQVKGINRDEEGTVAGAEEGKAEYLNHFIGSSYMEGASWFMETDHLTFVSLELDDTENIGYVYKALGAAFRRLRVAMQVCAKDGNHELEYGDVLKILITELVMEGGDADTNACVAGALLGTFLGWKDSSAQWRDNLKEGVWLEWMTEGLCDILGFLEGGFVGSMCSNTVLDGGRVLYGRA
jgi:hypothetical protein